MSRRARALLIFLPPVVVAALAVAALWAPARLRGRITAELRRQLAEALSGTVALGAAEGDLSGRLQIHDFTLTDAQGGPLLAIGDISVSFDPTAAVLHWQQPLTALRRLAVTDFRLTVEHTPAGWNFAGLLKPRKRPPTAPFEGTIEFARGVMTVRDTTRPQPLDLTLQDCAGTVTFTRDGGYQGELSGRDASGRLGRVRLTLTMNATHLTTVTVAVTGADLGAVWAALAPTDAVTLSSGTADAEAMVTIVAGSGEPPSVFARGQVRNARLTAKGAPPIDDLSGDFAYTGDAILLDRATGRIAGGQVQVNGEIRDLRQPHLNLDAQVLGVSPAALAQWLPKSLPVTAMGAISGQVAVVGPLASPQIEVVASAPRLAVSGHAVEQAQVHAFYGDGLVYVAQAQGRVQGAVVRGEAWATTGALRPRSGSATQPSAFFRGAATGVDLAALAKTQTVKSLSGKPLPAIEGTAQAMLASRIENGAFRVAADVIVRDGVIGPIGYDGIRAQVETDGKTARVARAAAETGVGTFVGAGTVGADGALDARVFSPNLMVGAIGGLTGVSVEAQQAAAAVHLTGTVKDPHGDATLQMASGTAADLPFDFVNAHAQFTRDRLDIKQAEVRSQGAVLNAHGTITDPLKGGAAALDLTVDARDVPLARLAALALVGLPQSSSSLELSLSGYLNDVVTVSGTAGDPRVNGHAILVFPVVAGFPLEQGDVVYHYADGTVTLDEATFTGGAGEHSTLITASGRYALKGAADLAFHAEGIPLHKLPAPETTDTRLAVWGWADVDGTLTGTEPKLTVHAWAPTLELNGQTLTDFDLVGSWDPEAFALDPVQFKFGDGAYRLKWSSDFDNGLIVELTAKGASIEPLTRLLDGTLRRADGSRSRLGAQLATVPRPLRGRLDADIAVQVGSPITGTATLDVTDAVMGGRPFPALHAALSYRNPVLRLDSVTLAQGDATADAQGVIDPSGDVDVSLVAHNLSADLFQPWLGRLPAEGSADVTAVLRGPYDAPTMQASVEATGLRVWGRALEGFRIDYLTIDEAGVHIAEGAIAAGGDEVRFHGDFPLILGPGPMLDPQRPFSLTFDLAPGGRGVVKTMFPSVALGAGTLDGSVTVSGTSAALTWAGAVHLADATIESDYLGAPLTQAHGTLAISVTEARLENTSATQGDQVITAAGKTALPAALERSAWRAQPYHAEISAGEGLAVRYPRRFDGIVSGALQLDRASADAPRPSLKGNLHLKSGTVRLTTQVAPTEPPAFDADLEKIVLEVGPGVWIRSNQFEVNLEGKGQLDGTVRDPDARLTLDGLEGFVRAPGGRLRVNEFHLDLQASWRGVQATLALRAEGTVGERVVSLELSGPLNEPKVTLRSVPPAPEGELYAQVFGISPQLAEGAGLGGALVDQMLGGLSSAVFAPAFGEIARSLGLNEFGFEFDQTQTVRIRLSTALSERLILSYSTVGSASVPNRAFRIAYRAGKRWWVAYTTQEPRASRFEVSAFFRF